MLSCDFRTEEFSKAADKNKFLNLLISMALLHSKYGTCYFIKLILTFIINFRLFVKHYQHIPFTETAHGRQLRESYLNRFSSLIMVTEKKEIRIENIKNKPSITLY